jgi:two-component system sensor histidine kinase/response regulator
MEQFKILVVDDDDITRSFLGDILRHEGYQTALAENGRKAEQHLGQDVPDLIISDVMMPEVNGLDLFRWVQEEDRLQNIPFIFLTSLDDGEALISLKELGPDDYLQKPVRPRHLLATVKGKLLRKVRREEQAGREQERVRDRIRWTLSHELRTPLTIIQGISELLLTDNPTQPAGDYQDLLKNLRSQSFQLGSLIENFLLVTRLDSGVEREIWKKGAAPCSLKEVLEEAAFPWWERARSSGAHFALELPASLPQVSVYRPHLLEILRQILDNGFKFADPASPRIVVRAGEEGGQVWVTVSDNGRGIPPAQHHLLFQKLTQVDREVHEQQGSGLGLYIARELVELNGGTIALRDGSGPGAEIEVRLPPVRP